MNSNELKESIRDKFITKVELNYSIENSSRLEITLLNNMTDKSFSLHLIGLKNLAIFENDFNGGLCLSHLKLFQLKDGYFYFSFDPYNENNNHSDEKDNFVVTCKRFEIHQ